MTVELRVDPIACEAHGLCSELFPEWIVLDDWGYPIVDPRPIPPQHADHARRAVAACPTLALRLQRSAGMMGADSATTSHVSGAEQAKERIHGDR